MKAFFGLTVAISIAVSYQKTFQITNPFLNHLFRLDVLSEQSSKIEKIIIAYLVVFNVAFTIFI